MVEDIRRRPKEELSVPSGKAEVRIFLAYFFLVFWFGLCVEPVLTTGGPAVFAEPILF